MFLLVHLQIISVTIQVAKIILYFVTIRKITEFELKFGIMLSYVFKTS